MNAGKLAGANPLYNTGKVVSGAGGRNVTDGPFAESKEAVGGYFLVNVAGEEEAVSIARGCPLLDHGWSVEVRPVSPECAMAGRIRASSELVNA
jgi:hypothetical protein